MDFKREAIDKLKSCDAKQQSLQRTSEEILRLEEEMVSLQGASSDSTPVSGGGSTQDEALVNNIALRAELAKARTATKRWLDTVDAALSILNDEEFRILDKMFIHPRKGQVAHLCGELHIEKSALYTKRNAALRRFTLALYGVTEL